VSSSTDHQNDQQNNDQNDQNQSQAKSATNGSRDSNSNRRPSQISLQIKVIALVLVTSAAMFGGMLWKTESLLLQEKTALINDSAMKQIAPLKRLVQQRLTDEKNLLVEFAGIRVGQNAPGQNQRAMNANFGTFEVISLMQVGENGQWSPSWVERSPNAKEDRWPRGHDLTLLKSLAYSRIRDGETVWSRVSDRQGAPVYAFMISVEIQAAGNERAENVMTDKAAKALPDTADQALANINQSAKAVLVGFSGTNPLAAVTEDFIGSTNSVYLVDDRGYVASHVNKAYLGALFTEDPLVREIIKGRKSGSTGKFEDLESRPVLGHYERVEHSNLYAVITTPEQILTSMLGSQRQAAILWGVALLLGVLGLASLVSWRIAKQATRPDGAEFAFASEIPEATAQAKSVEAVQPVIEAPAPATPPSVLAAALAPPPPPPPVRERSASEKILTDGLMQALTEPLHGILGHASLVRVKAAEEDIQDHADSISREARRMRDVVERIHDWQDETVFSADAEKKSEERTDLNVAISAALKERESDFTTEDVHVIRELRPLPLLKGNQESLQNAIGRLIDNAIEAMHARPSKHLRIETRFENEKIQLRVTDTGIGMSRDVRDRAFDPFFKGFESPSRLGLGLSSVAATVKKFGGTQAIESVMGEGSTFTFHFPVTVAEREAFNERDLRSIAEEVSQAATIRKEPEVETAAGVATAEPQLEPVTEPVTEPETISSFSDNDADEEDLKIEVIQPSLFGSRIQDEILEEEPKNAGPGPLMLDELDDDDEIFANIPLSKASSRLTKVGQLAPLKAEFEAKAEPVKEARSQKFEVKVRKPRMKKPKDAPEKGAE
jgi:signal transduction histidine kinase